MLLLYGDQDFSLSRSKNTYLAEEVIRGKRLNKSNPLLKWNSLRFNLSGSVHYDHTLPWVSKVWEEEGRVILTNDYNCYVDDVRICGYSKKGSWATIRQVMSIAQALGMQGTSRRQIELRRGGTPWAGR